METDKVILYAHYKCQGVENIQEVLNYNLHVVSMQFATLRLTSFQHGLAVWRMTPLAKLLNSRENDEIPLTDKQ